MKSTVTHHVACPADPEQPVAFSVVIPTLNEVDNILELYARLDIALAGIRTEVLIVDDASADGTADLAEAAAPGRCFSVRVIRRTGPRGLSASIKDGLRAARGDRIAVMDADLQHDESRLPRLYSALDRHDLAIGSRYCADGKTIRWSLLREAESRLAAALTRAILHLHVADPLAGFFAVRKSALLPLLPTIEARGWKILLDILAVLPNARVTEVPYAFRDRHAGETKMEWRVTAAWLRQLVVLARRRSPFADAVLRVRPDGGGVVPATGVSR